MARSREYNREEVLDAATQVFWEKGFKGSSMNDLVQATGLNKHSMYQEFNNKEELFRECIDNFAGKIGREPYEILVKEPVGFDNIVAFFKERIHYILEGPGNGCMIVNSAIEKELIDEKAFSQVTGYLGKHEHLFKNCLVEAQKQGVVSREKDSGKLARYLLTFTMGLMVLAKTNPDKESLESLVDTTLEMVKK